MCILGKQGEGVCFSFSDCLLWQNLCHLQPFFILFLPVFFSVCLGYLSNDQDYFKVFVLAAFFESIWFAFWKKNKKQKTKHNKPPTNQTSFIM